jgi:hypothetical protein
MNMKYVVNILVIFLLAGCVGDDESMNYSMTELSELNYTIAENNIELRYTPPMESLYYSPGVDVQQGDDFVIISIKRCNINDKCDVTIATNQTAAEHVVALNFEQEYSPAQIFINNKNESNSLSVLVSQ